MKTHKKLSSLQPDVAVQLANYLSNILIADERDWKKIRKVSRLITKKTAR
ncbi:MAG: hypothetical protein V4590_14935 [Bacteroidota bacterium]